MSEKQMIRTKYYATFPQKENHMYNTCILMTDYSRPFFNNGLILELIITRINPDKSVMSTIHFTTLQLVQTIETRAIKSHATTLLAII